MTPILLLVLGLLLAGLVAGAPGVFLAGILVLGVVFWALVWFYVGTFGRV